MSDEQRYTRDKNACNTWIIKWYPLDNYFHHLYRKIMVSLTKCVACRFVVAKKWKVWATKLLWGYKKVSYVITLNYDQLKRKHEQLKYLNYIPINKGDFMVIHEFFQVPYSILQHRAALAVGEFSKYKNRTILQIMHNLPQWEQQELVSSYLLGSSTRFLAFDLRQLQHRTICNFSCLLIWRYVHTCNYGI